jgi:hypothetical protein
MSPMAYTLVPRDVAGTEAFRPKSAARPRRAREKNCLAAVDLPARRCTGTSISITPIAYSTQLKVRFTLLSRRLRTRHDCRITDWTMQTIPFDAGAPLLR